MSTMGSAEMEEELRRQDSRSREDTLRIHRLEQERAQHLNIISSLEEELRHARFDAARNSMLLLAEKELQKNSHALKAHAHAEAEQVVSLKREIERQGRRLGELQAESDCHRQAREQLSTSMQALLTSKDSMLKRHAQELEAMHGAQVLLQQEVTQLSAQLSDLTASSKEQLGALQARLREQEAASGEQLQVLQQQLASANAAHAEELHGAREQLGQQIEAAQAQLQQAKQQLEEQGQLVALGDQLRSALEERVSEAEMESVRLLQLQGQLEADSGAYQAEARQAQASISQLEERLAAEEQVRRRGKGRGGRGEGKVGFMGG
jgi:hypothetical protein